MMKKLQRERERMRNITNFLQTQIQNSVTNVSNIEFKYNHPNSKVNEIQTQIQMK